MIKESDDMNFAKNISELKQFKYILLEKEKEINSYKNDINNLVFQNNMLLQQAQTNFKEENMKNSSFGENFMLF